MSRSLRLCIPHGHHHVVVKGNNGMPVFEDDEDCETYLELIDEAHQRFDIYLDAFSFVWNHAHLNVFDPNGELSRAMHLINTSFAQRFNRSRNRTGHVFQNRFWSSLVDTDAYFRDSVAYTLRNGVSAGMVERARDHTQCALPIYLGMASPPRWMRTAVWSGLFGHDRVAMEAFVDRADLHQDVVRGCSSQPMPPTIGRQQWASQIVKPVIRSLGTDAARRKVHRRQPTLSELCTVVAVSFDVSEEDLQRSVRGRRNDARLALCHLSHINGLPLHRTAMALGNTSPSSIVKASRRFANLAERDPLLERRLRACVRHVEILTAPLPFTAIPLAS